MTTATLPDVDDRLPDAPIRPEDAQISAGHDRLRAEIERDKELERQRTRDENTQAHERACYLWCQWCALPELKNDAAALRDRLSAVEAEIAATPLGKEAAGLRRDIDGLEREIALADYAPRELHELWRTRPGLFQQDDSRYMQPRRHFFQPDRDPPKPKEPAKG